MHVRHPDGHVFRIASSSSSTGQTPVASCDDDAALRWALDQLRVLGAGPAAAIVAGKLRVRGVCGVARGPRPGTRENPADLTAREREVLALLAEGLRSGQIVERLVVSQRTVDHHVCAVLRKLDVHTRGEASVKATRLVSPPRHPRARAHRLVTQR